MTGKLTGQGKLMLADQAMATLLCAGWCEQSGTVSMIDRKGYVYCEPCGHRRRSSGTPCRKLLARELATLESGKPIPAY